MYVMMLFLYMMVAEDQELNMYSDFFLNSYDLSIFLLRQRKHLDLPMKSVALDLGVSISTLSRIVFI